MARVMPSDDEVRYAHRVCHAKYDSKMENLDYPSELAQKITKKRAELGRLDYMEQQALKNNPGE